MFLNAQSASASESGYCRITGLGNPSTRYEALKLRFTFSVEGVETVSATRFHGSRSKQAEYACIQVEIRSHEEAIRLLRARHNSLSITTQLPSEVLSLIFQWNAIVQPSNNFPSWINVSYVCQHWRRIALECRALWSAIEFKHLKWTDELLTRSRSAPLDVHFEDGFRSSVKVQALQKILTEHKLKSLSLSPFKTTPLKGIGLFKTILSQPAPTLDMFVVHGVLEEPGSESIVPMNLFGGCAPKLRTLELWGCRISPELPFFAGLTTFKLRYKPVIWHTDSMRSKIFVLNDLIRSLSAMPLLETLVLCNIYKTRLPTSLHSNIIAELHNLRYFEVDNPFIVYEALLPRLVYPKTTHQRFILSSFRGPGTGQSEYLQAILSDLQRIGHLISKRIPLGRCMHISDDPETTHIAVWDRAGLVSCPPTGIPNLQFNLSPPPGAEDFCFHHAHKVACVSALWGALPLARLESLHIDSTTIDRMMWSNFGKKNLLKNIRLRIGCSPRMERNFIEELQSGIPDKDISNVLYAHPKPSKLPFRALQNLILDGWTGDSFGYDFTSTSWLHLCLRERRKRGVALRQLRFLRTIKPRDNDFEEVFKRISAVVPHAYWDVSDGPVDGGEVTDNA